MIPTQKQTRVPLGCPGEFKKKRKRKALRMLWFKHVSRKGGSVVVSRCGFLCGLFFIK